MYHSHPIHFPLLALPLSLSLPLSMSANPFVYPFFSISLSIFSYQYIDPCKPAHCSLSVNSLSLSAHPFSCQPFCKSIFLCQSVGLSNFSLSANQFSLLGNPNPIFPVGKSYFPITLFTFLCHQIHFSLRSNSCFCPQTHFLF